MVESLVQAQVSIAGMGGRKQQGKQALGKTVVPAGRPSPSLYVVSGVAKTRKRGGKGRPLPTTVTHLSRVFEPGGVPEQLDEEPGGFEQQPLASSTTPVGLSI